MEKSSWLIIFLGGSGGFISALPRLLTSPLRHKSLNHQKCDIIPGMHITTGSSLRFLHNTCSLLIMQGITPFIMKVCLPTDRDAHLKSESAAQDASPVGLYSGGTLPGVAQLPLGRHAPECRLYDDG